VEVRGTEEVAMVTEVKAMVVAVMGRVRGTAAEGRAALMVATARVMVVMGASKQHGNLQLNSASLYLPRS